MEEFNNVAEELTKLADLHDRGVLSDEEFVAQKGRLMGVSKRHVVRHGGVIAGAVVSLVALALLLLGALTPTSAPNVTFSTAALTENQVQIAINYAMGQVGHATYNGRCLQLVNDAYARAGVSIGSSDDPITYWSANPRGYTEHSAPNGPYGSPPAGAILFWGATKWSSDGHAAISLGNGSVVSSAAYPYADGPTNGEVFQLSSRSPMTYHYLGYIIPGTLEAPSAPPAVAAAPVTTTPKPAAPTISSGGSQPVGASQLQPAAGAGALQGPGSISTPGAITPPSPPASSVPPVTAPFPATTTTTTVPKTTATPPPPSPPPAPPATYGETTGGVSHTWTDYQDAGGTEGPSIASNQTVQIACKLAGFTVADGNTWWYRIASSPWNSAYYVSADAFYNDGATSGSLIGTPFVDPAVPNC